MHKIIWILLIIMGWSTVKDVLENIEYGYSWTEIHRTGVNDFFPHWFSFLYGIIIMIMGIFLLIFV